MTNDISYKEKKSNFYIQDDKISKSVQQILNISSSERVLDVQDNRILTARKDGFQTHIMLGNIFLRYTMNCNKMYGLLLTLLLFFIFINPSRKK